MPRITVEVVQLVTGPAYRVTRGRNVWIRDTLEGLRSLRLPLDLITLRDSGPGAASTPPVARSRAGSR